MISFGPLDTVVNLAYDTLVQLTDALHPIDGGAAAALAVVLLTATVRLLLVPLSRRQVAAQQTQLRLAPRMKALRDKHAGDPARFSAELNDLYREAGTSPFASIVPALLQAPAFYLLYTVFTSATIDGGRNVLLATELFGTALGAHGLAAGWPLLALMAGIAMVATFNAVRVRRAGQPAWLMALPYVTLVPAAIMPLAAGFYLLTTTAWSAAETTLLRRAYSEADRST